MSPHPKLPISRQDQAASAEGFALFALGFRPFFLLAALMGAIWMLLWIAVLQGWVALPLGNAVAWHGHEMVFGYTIAVIAGFLLTAVRNWTGHPTASGVALALLCLVWVAGRVASLFSGTLPDWVVASVDLAFLPLLLVAVAIPLVKAGNRRNYALALFLFVLFAINVLFHFAESTVGLLQFAVDIVALIIIVIGGRVIPFFTRNALKIETASHGFSDWAAAITTGLVAVAAVAGLSGPVLGFLSLLAGAFNLWRMRDWRFFASFRKPILAVLHVGYAWVGISLILRGFYLSGAAIPATAALHAMTAGAIGTLTFGMMSRVALGHTGRVIEASTSMTTAYVLITLAAVFRVMGPIVLPAMQSSLWTIAGILWSAAFVLFLTRNTMILLRPRPDGKPG